MTNGYSTSNLEAFVDTVRLKSFSAVARKRGLTASSVARQINALEQELSVLLFHRTTRALTLTEAGCTLFERSERILEELANVKSEVRSLRREVHGLLRICCWPTFGKKHILPHLPSLMEQYPELRIELDLSERLNDPVLERTDLIFRIGELVDSTLRVTYFASQRSVFAASPEYIARHGTPTTLADCTQHRLIDKRHIAQFLGWRILLGESRSVLKSLVFQTDDLQAQVDACVAGLGIVHLPDWTVYDRVTTGELVLLTLEDASPENVGIYLLRNPGSTTAAIEAFEAHIRRCIGLPPLWETIHSTNPFDESKNHNS